MRSYIHRCPKCKSVALNTYKMPTGPIWCMTCNYRIAKKENDKSFTELIGGEKVKKAKLFDFVGVKELDEFGIMPNLRACMENEKEVACELDIFNKIVYVYQVDPITGACTHGIKCDIRYYENNTFLITSDNFNFILIVENDL